ncbi:MAG TPA: flagellar filament capping protein FliD [Bryobacteraceae bacterium]|nr:flagellar filament capping protein FliD [Bryobacteraceae bacterium]
MSTSITSAAYNANPTFTGSSSYSSSFQQVLTRAVQMASLPMQQVEADISTATNESSAISSLENTFGSLDSAVQAVGTAAAGSAAATVSDTSSISATATSSALPGTYTIQVDSLGSYTTTLSPAGSSAVTDPSTQNISSASSFTLTVNGGNTTITPSGNSLDDLAAAINGASAGVQATIVNMGSAASADYRLVVTSDSLSADTISLSDGSSQLLNTISTGAAATYQVNGSSTVLQSNSPQVTLSPGLTVTLLGQSSSPVTVTVSTDYSSLQTALSNLASAYNSAFSAVQAQVGQSGGALAGQSIVYTLQNVLQQVSQFSSNSSGAVNTLADLGLTLSDTGQMSFDASTFSAQNASNISQFLGGASSGGFLQTAESALSGVDDSTTGALEAEYAAFQTQITGDNQQVTDDQARIGLMETNLEAELAQADAAIATLETQKTYYQDLFQAEYSSSST